MKNLTVEQAEEISKALKLLSTAAQKLSTALEESNYELESAPEYLEDSSDFAYDMITMTEEELDKLKAVLQNAETYFTTIA